MSRFLGNPAIPLGKACRSAEQVTNSEDIVCSRVCYQYLWVLTLESNRTVTKRMDLKSAELPPAGSKIAMAYARR